jgi:voltage-gated potassium channel
MRLASEMVRPQVVRFLDEMLRDKEANLRIEEAYVGEAGPIVGKALRDAGIRDKTGAMVIAVRTTEGKVTHVPSGDLVVAPGQTLVVIGTPNDVQRLREAVGHSDDR